MATYHVLAIDPGVHTGLSFTTLFDHNQFQIAPQRVHTNTVKFPRDFSTDSAAARCWEAIQEILEWVVPLEEGIADAQAIWAFELFRLQPGKAHNSRPEGFSAMWIHAQMALVSGMSDRTKLLRFTPGTSKGQCTDQRLKKAGLWVKGSPHQRDANRILWMTSRQLRHG